MESLGFPDVCSPQTYDVVKKTKHDEGGTYSVRVPSQKRNHSDVAVSSYTSPTLRQTNLQNQDILVVLGGELT